MTKNILISGILGGVVMFAAMMVFRFLLPLGAYPELLAMPDQVPIHAQLKERIVKPGRYVCPYLPEHEMNALFPDYLNEPVFTVTYTGFTHGSARGFVSPGMLAFLLAPMVAAWVLAHASDKVLASYMRRVFFVSILGLLIAVSTHLLANFASDLSFAAAVGRAIASVVTWALIGLVLAWRIRPMAAGNA